MEDKLFETDVLDLREFLFVLYKYKNTLLYDYTIKEVAITFIKKGFYKPKKVSRAIIENWNNNVELSDSEAEKVFNDNPQSHKEAGFDKGWASRFDTWFKIAKELGFVYYSMNNKIVFSPVGKLLIDLDNPQNEQLVFINSFAKYYRNNPFRKVSNENKPLILLLEVIKLLNADEDYNGAGLSKKEIPILLCWRNNNAQELYERIKSLRTKYRFALSDEVVLDTCDLYLDKIKRNESSILVDYPDDFIRKMRLTGLITLRGGGRFIDINHKEDKLIQYILKEHSTYTVHTKEVDFFNHIGKIDRGIEKIFLKQSSFLEQELSSNEIQKWVDYYDWEVIKSELTNLSNKRGSKDSILKVIEQPLRLEFLTALAIMKNLPNVLVKPNFISDDEGLPVRFASGGGADIECKERNIKILIEVTLLKGTQQHIRESFSIQRHLEDAIKRGEEACTVFISPKVYIDTCRYVNFVKVQDNLNIHVLDINDFITQLEKYDTFENVTSTYSSCE